MTALGAVINIPVTVATVSFTTAAASVAYGTIGAISSPVPQILGGYAIAGTQPPPTRVVPVWGQLFPRGDNQW
jgi:hypothetical protein